ncbi:MAG: hypothetical protein ACRC2U_17805, partial [Aeromonas sp.]
MALSIDYAPSPDEAGGTVADCGANGIAKGEVEVEVDAEGEACAALSARVARTRAISTKLWA